MQKCKSVNCAEAMRLSFTFRCMMQIGSEKCNYVPAAVGAKTVEGRTLLGRWHLLLQSDVAQLYLERSSYRLVRGPM